MYPGEWLSRNHDQYPVADGVPWPPPGLERPGRLDLVRRAGAGSGRRRRDVHPGPADRRGRRWPAGQEGQPTPEPLSPTRPRSSAAPAAAGCRAAGTTTRRTTGASSPASTPWPTRWTTRRRSTSRSRPSYPPWTSGSPACSTRPTSTPLARRWPRLRARPIRTWPGPRRRCGSWRTATSGWRKYRAALDAGADATVVAGWMAEVQAEKLRAEQELVRSKPADAFDAEAIRALRRAAGANGGRAGGGEPTKRRPSCTTPSASS